MSPQGRSEPAQSAISQLRSEYTRLLATAEAEAKAKVAEHKRTARGRERFYPSRLNTKGLAELQVVFTQAYAQAIERRFGQLARLNAKLVRSDPDWIDRTPDEIREPPALGMAAL